MPDFLTGLLKPARLTEVVDIGANPIDGDPPYKVMLDAGLCRLTGFEPQPHALEALNAQKGPNERYLPFVVFDGAVHDIHVCRGTGFTSLFEPDPVNLALFQTLAPMAQVVHKAPISTRTIDASDEIANVDFLKIDVQGAELGVFQHGREKLKQAVAIQTEVSFTTIYKGQPAFGDIDVELRAQGFVPHCFVDVKQWPIAPYQTEENRIPLNHLLEADILYVRDFARPDLMSDEQIKHLILIAHHCYHSFDLALRLMVVLVSRNVISREYLQAFVAHLKQIGAPGNL